MITWFKRSDGLLLAAEEGSAQFQMMSKSGEFELCDAEGNAIENETDSDKSDLGNADATVEAQQNSPTKRGSTRKSDKEKDS